MRCYVYPAKKKRTISTSLLRKIPSLLIGVFGLTCRPVPPRAAQLGYLPVSATCRAVPPGAPNPMWRAPVPSVPPGTNRTQVRIGVEGALELLGIDLVANHVQMFSDLMICHFKESVHLENCLVFLWKLFENISKEISSI